ncbi:MAG: DUF4384 domain-containing protein, partial [Propylenella sp.]
MRGLGLVCFSATLSVISSVAAAQDDPAAAALKVFTDHCSRCHQDGNLIEREKPAGGFGYILDLEALARNPEYIQAGNPNASQVYTRIINQSMPKDMDYATVFGPSADEAKAIATWIESLAGAATATIASREFIDDETMLRAMNDDLSQLSDIERPRMRYFTLTHLYNVGDTDAEMEIYRQALSKLLNSLSTESAMMIPVPIDEVKTIFRVDISDLGWDEDTWKEVEKSNPYFVEYDSPFMTALQTETKAKVPFVRADWFGYTGSKPPLYYTILDLPETAAELEKKLGIDVAKNRADLKIARAGFQQSGVSRNNRMIERHSLSTGAYWESFDFAGNKEKQSFFLNPLGPQKAFAAFSDQFGFVHDGGEIIFSLPNGLQAYFLATGDGKRLTTGPTQIVQDPSRRDQAVTNGISCMSCHSRGIQFKEDQVRDYALGNFALPKDAREIVEEIFPPKEEMQALMQADYDRFNEALEEAGVDPALSLSGEEIVSSLFLRFERDLTMPQAAAEMGMDVAEFEERLNKGSADSYALKQRLQFNLMPRDQFVELFAGLVNEITDHTATDLREDKAKVAASNPESTKRFNLALFPNGLDFKVGSELTFSVIAEKDCFLTLINVDEKGSTTVLFPNKFNNNNRIVAGKTFTLPGAEISGFRFRFQDPGKETVIAKCNATKNQVRGIEHHFEQAAYTTFRSYDDYVTRAIAPRQIAVTDDSGRAAEQEAAATTEQKPAEAAAATPEQKPAETAAATPEQKPAEAAAATPEQKPAEAAAATPEQKPAEAA